MEAIKSPSDIVPKEVEIELNGKPYVLKKWTLKVDAWIQARFGVDKLELFKNLTTEQAGRLVFHLINNKKDFQAETITDYDDDGNEVQKVVTGWEKVLDCISGPAEEAKIANKLLECYGISIPDISESVAEENKKKSKAIATQKSEEK